MDATSLTDWVTSLSAARMRQLFDGSIHSATDWVRAIACDGVAAAQVCYGRLLLAGTGVAQDAEQALLWFQRAARQRHPDGINMVGRCYENGWGCRVDHALAVACYHDAAAAGHDWAQYNLGHCYLDGVGVERDFSKAYECYSRASAQGHARAMNLVGRCAEHGWGTPPDFRAAADWYRRSAEAGYFRGQFNWASILLRADRLAEAAYWFERAADGGTPPVRQVIARLMPSLAARCA